jgi:hypothetical protein
MDSRFLEERHVVGEGAAMIEESERVSIQDQHEVIRLAGNDGFVVGEVAQLVEWRA